MGSADAQHPGSVLEKKLLSHALIIHGTDREVARMLSVDHSTVVRKMRKYGLQAARTGNRRNGPGGLSHAQ